MPSANSNHGDGRMRTYYREESAVFLKTKEEFGGLSNMAGGFPLLVNGVYIRTSEALYQACRFPHKPDLQRLIIEQHSPMSAKMKGKPYRPESRSDWDVVRVKIMRWCLAVKLAQNWYAFSELLESTGESPIVEQSRNDDFWGAKPVDSDTLIGVNALGRLLMELREKVKEEHRDSLLCVKPLPMPNFLLYGTEIAEIDEIPYYLVEPASIPAPTLDSDESSTDAEPPTESTETNGPVPASWQYAVIVD